MIAETDAQIQDLTERLTLLRDELHPSNDADLVIDAIETIANLRQQLAKEQEVNRLVKQGVTAAVERTEEGSLK